MHASNQLGSCMSNDMMPSVDISFMLFFFYCNKLEMNEYEMKTHFLFWIFFSSEMTRWSSYLFVFHNLFFSLHHTIVSHPAPHRRRHYKNIYYFLLVQLLVLLYKNDRHSCPHMCVLGFWYVKRLILILASYPKYFIRRVGGLRFPPLLS